MTNSTVKIVAYDEEGRYEDTGVLLAPGIAVLSDRSTFYFIRIKPSDEPGFFVESEVICDVAIMNVSRDVDADIAYIPEGALSFAMWAAGLMPAAVAV